jgi:hypothetical protein
MTRRSTSLLPALLANDRGGQLLLGLLLLAAMLVPLGNLLLPADSVLHIPTYVVSLLGKYLCYALLALAVDLIWGYCGILSPRPRRLLRARRLCDGHVSDAADR